MARSTRTLLVGLAVVGAGILLAALRVNPYVYFAGYVILQYVVMATAWNILGGYAGYVNFGTPAFFALGAYTAVFLIQSTRAPLPVLILAGGLVSGLLGLGIGYLTLRLRGVLLGVAGAPFPYYVTFVEPTSAFNLDYAVNALAMPMIGGTTSWAGPVIGAVLLGTAQQLATVTISSEMNLFIVGVVLVAFVVLAPEGILGLVRRLRGR